MTLGSSRALFPGAETTRKVKIRSAATNLIPVIKRVLEASVNAQPKVLMHQPCYGTHAIAK
jgi:hypothetical protein